MSLQADAKVEVARSEDAAAQGAPRFLESIVTGAMLAWHRRVSPWLPPLCRFYPSCSVYAAEAVSRHGLLRGVGLALVRLSKCHPFHPGGFDPVK